MPNKNNIIIRMKNCTKSLVIFLVALAVCAATVYVFQDGIKLGIEKINGKDVKTPSVTSTDVKKNQPVKEVPQGFKVQSSRYHETMLVDNSPVRDVAKGFFVDDGINREVKIVIKDTTIIDASKEVVTKQDITEKIIEILEEKIVAEEVVVKPIIREYDIFGHELILNADVGKATISYPAEVISEEDIVGFINELASGSYSELLQNVNYKFTKDGEMVLTYPEAFSVEEFAMAEKFLTKALPLYVASLVEESDAKITPYVIEYEPVVVFEPIERNYEVAGYNLKVTADKGKATIKYPSFISNADIYNAASSVVSSYGAYLKDVTYKFLGNGALEVYYPESYGAEEFAIAEQILSKELPAYIESLLTPPVVEAPVVVEQPKFEPIVKNYELYGYKLKVVIDEGKATVSYPNVIGKDDILKAAEAALGKYSRELKDVEFKVSKSGQLEVTYPESYGAEELLLAEKLIAKELPAYIESLLTPPVVEEPVVETPAVTEPVVETPVAEEPVVETPAVTEPVVETPVAEEPVVETPVVEDEVVKGPKSIITIPGLIKLFTTKPVIKHSK